MIDEQSAKKNKFTKDLLKGLYIVGAFGVGLFIILLNIISRGGWFILLSFLLASFLIFVILYIMFILFILFITKQPETVIFDEEEGKARLEARKQKEKGEGIHIRFGRTDK